MPSPLTAPTSSGLRPTTLLQPSLLLLLLLVLPALLLLRAAPALADDTNGHDSDKAEEPEGFEPPFPQLLAANELDNDGQVRLVAEIVDLSPGGAGSTSVEELCDFRRSRCALIVSSPQQEQTKVYMSDLKTRKVFEYEPHVCKMDDLSTLQVYGSAPIWQARLEKSKVHGLVGLWLNAVDSVKSYASAKLQLQLSAGNLARELAHTWTLAEPAENGSPVQLIFERGLDNARYELATVRLLESKGSKPLKVINVLSVERSIENSLANKYLELPVGYGCAEAGRKSLRQLEFVIQTDSTLHKAWLYGSYSAEMEIMARRHGLQSAAEQSHDQALRETTNKFVHFARSNSLSSQLLLVHQRDQISDLKSVYDYEFHVRYDIDTSKGTCKLHNIPGSYKLDAGDSEHLPVTFANGLTLELDLNMIYNLLEGTLDFFMVKQTSSADGMVLYFEATLPRVLPKHVVRVVRTFHRSIFSSTLMNVGLMVLSDDQSKVIESYTFNMLRYQPLQDASQMAKLFDIADECYLNDARMESGRDYAWLQLSYPITGAVRTLLEANAYLVEDTLRGRLTFDGLPNWFHAPRVELEFDQDQLQARVLLLNHAPVEYLYEELKGSSYTNADNTLQLLTSNLDRCARLCESHLCETMTYCTDVHKCLISTTRAKNTEINRKASPSCTTYTSNFLQNEASLARISLSRMLAELRATARNRTQVPEMPDILALSLSESGATMEERAQATYDYRLKVENALYGSKCALDGLMLLMPFVSQLVVLVPSEFELVDVEESGRGVDPDLKAAMVGHKLSVNALMKAEKAEIKWRAFTGLSYQQCELACQDLGCSSLSYCSTSMQCVVSDIYELTGSGKLEVDGDCVIGQRDFLSKFERFEDVYRQDKYDQVLVAANPSECAHICAAAPVSSAEGGQEGPGCLAFDFCGTDQCLLMSRRRSSSPRLAAAAVSNTCDHYTRSYVADFARAAHLTLEPEEMSKLTPRRVAGLTLDRCAEMCARELLTCTAFQYCFDPMADSRDAQTCDLIETLKDTHEQVPLANTSLMVDSDVCHLFALRSSAAAELSRTPAFSITSGADTLPVQASGRTFWGSLGSLLCVVLVAGSLTLLAHQTYERSPAFRDRVHSARAMLGR